MIPISYRYHIHHPLLQLYLQLSHFSWLKEQNQHNNIATFRHWSGEGGFHQADEGGVGCWWIRCWKRGEWRWQQIIRGKINNSSNWSTQKLLCFTFSCYNPVITHPLLCNIDLSEPKHTATPKRNTHFLQMCMKRATGRILQWIIFGAPWRQWIGDIVLAILEISIAWSWTKITVIFNYHHN